MSFFVCVDSYFLTFKNIYSPFHTSQYAIYEGRTRKVSDSTSELDETISKIVRVHKLILTCEKC